MLMAYDASVLEDIRLLPLQIPDSWYPVDTHARLYA